MGLTAGVEALRHRGVSAGHWAHRIDTPRTACPRWLPGAVGLWWAKGRSSKGFSGMSGMADVVAHDALSGFAESAPRKQESSSRKVPQEEPLVPELTFPKRYKHRDVRSRSLSRHPKSTRCGRPRRIGRRGERNDVISEVSRMHVVLLATCAGIRSTSLRGSARQARQERGPQHAPAHRHSNARLQLKPLAGDAAYVFLSERQGPLTDSSMRKMIARAGELLG